MDLHNNAKTPADSGAVASIPPAMGSMDRARSSLDDIIANEELARRSSRRSDRVAEQRALDDLAHNLATSPRGILQKLADTAMALCRAQSAGVSLLEKGDGEALFRWHAVSGEFSHLIWGTMPRHFSPCGAVLDREETLLMVEPERHFTPLALIRPKIAEALLIPFRVRGQTIGTLWILAHDARRQFDDEDRRVLVSLATFAGIAYELLTAMRVGDLSQLSASRGRIPNAQWRAEKKRVLVVDDNPDSAQSLALLLQTMGHDAEVASDAPTALQLCRGQRSEMVLLDLVLPGMDGFEVARRLRQEHGSSMRIVAVTGFSGEDVRQRCIEAGFDHHAVKPIDPAFLKSLLG